ncbi:alpha/beta hydrolase [Rhizobium sp. S163]|uniref:alpha/beta hydrolase n=1 Tax=Rhizobium sp. S163 TaxID=3055039 RepID=UPI0025A99E8F|nr:alpha/beta hydrolase [Rhizobium sp. S163]MDM9646434.1 alpha/beta hydrolase [Rhizobium sp. S163]
MSLNIHPIRSLGAAAALSLLATVAMASQAKPDPQMQPVLDALNALQAKPFHTLSVSDARTQASPADAARTVQRDQKVSPYPEAKVATKDFAIPTAGGALPARAYIPEGEGPFPVVLYFHGGGWVVADLNTYDATPRALALGSKALVISVDYHHAPESKFPAQHDDAWAAYTWLVENVHTLNGDAKRVAVAGESAGGNLAANVALMAKEKKTTMPVYQLLVYPIAGNDTNTPSYQENANALPLGKADMEWFISNVFTSKDQTSDPRINLVGRKDLKGLPPATVVTAQIDPLRSEGQTYAKKLGEAGVKVNLISVDGVTHEFFGMAKVIDKAKTAVDAANADLTKAFGSAK